MINARLYTETQQRDLTPFVVSINTTNTTRAPYQRATLNLKIPFKLIKDVIPLRNNTYDLDAWIILKDEGDCFFFGKTSGMNTGITVKEEGLHETIPFSISVESFLYPMMTGQTFLSGLNVGLDGHIFDLKAWGPTLSNIMTAPFETRHVGKVFETLFHELSHYYKIPPTIAENTTLEAVKIVYDRQSALKHAPKREGLHKSVLGLAINAQNAIARGTAWNLVSNPFDADPTIIELFPSLEDVEPNEDLKPIERALNKKLTILYRFRPLQIESVEGSPASETYEDPFKKAYHIDQTLITSFSIGHTDTDRINAVYIDTPLNQSRSLELFNLIGRPILNKEDIEKNGLRLYKANYPFFPIGKKDQDTPAGFIQYLIDVVGSIALNTHHFFNGNLTAKYLKDIQPGSWIYVRIEGHSFLAYAEEIKHQINVNKHGLQTRRTSIQFTRGFFK